MPHKICLRAQRDPPKLIGFFMGYERVSIEIQVFYDSPSKFKLIASNVIPKQFVNKKCFSLDGT